MKQAPESEVGAYARSRNAPDDGCRPSYRQQLSDIECTFGKGLTLFGFEGILFYKLRKSCVNGLQSSQLGSEWGSPINSLEAVRNEYREATQRGPSLNTAEKWAYSSAG